VLIQIAVLIAISAIAILAGYCLLQLLAHARAATNASQQPGLADVLTTMEGYAYQGIFAGAELARRGLEQLGTTLSGGDRAAIANGIYDALPPVVTVAGVSVPIGVLKDMIGRTQFAQVVQDVYARTSAFVTANEKFLADQVTSMKVSQSHLTPGLAAAPLLAYGPLAPLLTPPTAGTPPVIQIVAHGPVTVSPGAVEVAPAPPPEAPVEPPDTQQKTDVTGQQAPANQPLVG